MASGFQKIDYLDLPLLGVKVNTNTDSSSLWPANCSWARFTNHFEDAQLAWQEKEDFPSCCPNHMGFGAETQYSDDFLQRSSFLTSFISTVSYQCWPNQCYSLLSVTFRIRRCLVPTSQFQQWGSNQTETKFYLHSFYTSDRSNYASF